jgi:glycosyltransferase involved in cell wall biosynthesis
MTNKTLIAHSPKTVVVLPAYNAAKTLAQTVREIPDGAADEVILVDDASADGTTTIARELGIRHIVRHETNKGYGANQKTCYRLALALGADIIVMLHPDYQYAPALIPELTRKIADEGYALVLGSRVADGAALKGGMPRYKYWANRFLTATQNCVFRLRLTEYHSGYRAFSRRALESLNFQAYSDGFLFDNQIIADCVAANLPIGEIPCPARYFPDASSLGFAASLRYGLGVLGVSLAYALRRFVRGIVKRTGL